MKIVRWQLVVQITELLLLLLLLMFTQPRYHLCGASFSHLVRLFNERVSRQGKAICSVRPSVGLFPLYILNQLTSELEFLFVHRL